jgi:acetate kinase
MQLFVINTGSSSIKYQLLDMPSGDWICQGLVERIGLDHSRIKHKERNVGGADEQEITISIPDHAVGLAEVARLLGEERRASIQAVGHRVVHGGEAFSATTVITDAVKAKIRALSALAPLHNPPNLLGIEVAEQVFPAAVQVAVFDTAFHQTIPPHAFRYAIPESLYREEGIRAYGFHGTSHKFVSEEAAHFLDYPAAKLVTLHLGNGCSMAAVDSGVCIDTSMGLGPMNGLVMGTRSGDIDQSVLFHLLREGRYTAESLNDLLQKQSGLLGMAGSSDMRDTRKAAASGNEQARVALDVYIYRIRKYIGAYVAVLGGLDALVFTAGVGEHDSHTRAEVCANLDYLGIRLDPIKNEAPTKGIRAIHQDDSTVAILVVPTNEELEIARQTFTLVAQMG